MLISIDKKIAFLAMTKTASTSIEMALAPYCDMAFYGNARVKHISYRRYSRFVVPYLDSLGYGGLETVCLMREPVSWLFSWYRYRSRPSITGKPQSTADLDFNTFVGLYLDASPVTRGIGRPSKFVADKNGIPAINHVFKYESLDTFRSFMEVRFGEHLNFERLNESPVADMHLDATVRRQLTGYFAPEYEIYENAIG